MEEAAEAAADDRVGDVCVVIEAALEGKVGSGNEVGAARWREQGAGEVRTVHFRLGLQVRGGCPRGRASAWFARPRPTPPQCWAVTWEGKGPNVQGDVAMADETVPVPVAYAVG
jgi:hypothetical protein